MSLSRTATAFLLLLAVGCASPSGATASEQRAYTLDVRSEALADLYQRRPEAREKVEAAPGYAFFSGFSLHPGLMTFANAYGVVEDAATHHQTYLRLSRFAVGPGLSVKGYYVVMIAKTAAAVDALRESQWFGGGLAEAGFRFGDTGGDAAGNFLDSDDFEAYLWTHTGVALEVALGGGKTYPKDELNEGASP